MKKADYLDIALIQSDIHWKNPEANRAEFEEKIRPLAGLVDLIVLPEMFTTGFADADPEICEPVGVHTLPWAKQMAAQTGAVICGSIMVREGGNNYNRLYWVRPDGSSEFYDKKHLFTLAGEQDTFTAGTKRLLVEIKGRTFCPLICYDLRFPVWSRNGADLPYDCLIYVANWPAPRISSWDTLLKARAIENSAFSLGVNRCGEDGKGLVYTGNSAVYDAKAATLFFAQNQEVTGRVRLNFAEQDAYREKFAVHADADGFRVL